MAPPQLATEIANANLADPVKYNASILAKYLREYPPFGDRYGEITHTKLSRHLKNHVRRLA